MRTKLVPWYLILASLVVALWLESVPILKSLRAFWPDWILLVLLFWNLFNPSRVGVGVAWLTGLIMDASQFALLGEHALEYVLVMLLAGYFHNKNDWSQWVTTILVVVCHPAGQRDDPSRYRNGVGAKYCILQFTGNPDHGSTDMAHISVFYVSVI